MRLRISHIIYITISAFLLMSVVSCHTRFNRTKKNILLILSFDKDHQGYIDYIDEIQKTMHEEGIEPDIKCLYCDLEFDRNSMDISLDQLKLEMNKEKWVPDAIITEGDRPVNQLLLPENQNILDLEHTPVIMGALHYPDWNNIKGHDNFVVWFDPISFKENIDLAVKMRGENCVLIELDYSPYDSLLRKNLAEAINCPPYINNMDFHVTSLDDREIRSSIKDSTLVNVISAEKPWLNSAEKDADPEKGKKVYDYILSTSWRYPNLIVKKDILCDVISRKTGRPQFTAVKTDFANGQALYLCGYFADYRTIANDCAQCAIAMFNGQTAASLTNRQHQKAYWMDYTAMMKWGLKYDDYKDEFNIVNAPFEVRYSTLLVWLYCMGGLLLCATIIFVLYKKYQDYKKRRHSQYERINEARIKTQLCLSGTDFIEVNSRSEIEFMFSGIHPEDSFMVGQIRDCLNEPGDHFFIARYKKENEEDYHNYEFAINVNATGELIGIVRNLDNDESMKFHTTLAERESEEAQKKMLFMMNLSKEIREPLKSITQYCDNLVKKDIDAKEKKRISKKIEKYTNQLINVISDILLFSRIESGRQQYIMKPIRADEFMSRIYEQYKGESTNSLKVLLFKGRPNVIVEADSDRLRDIISQYFSNAVKFTRKGSIGVGWQYQLGENMCEFFVEDSGKGINKAVQEKMFEMFWKENEFAEGVGLGLNICKSLAEAMGGHISVSTKEGYGSRFSIWIPARIEEKK